MSKVKGFTLLEIMLVILLLGMVSVGVVMTLPGSVGLDKDSQWHAQRFSRLLQFAQDHALISNSELGIEFSDQHYLFAYYDLRNKKWLPFNKELINGYTEIPESVVAEYSLAGNVWGIIDQGDNKSLFEKDFNSEDEEEIEIHPQIFIMSSGEVTPFSYRFYDLENDQRVTTVKVSMTGEVELLDK